MRRNGVLKRGITVAVALAAVMLMTTAVWAAGQLSAGPLKIRGQLTATWENESNIFKTERNETSDNIYKLEPVLGLRHDITSTTYYTFDYQGTFAWYSDNTNNNWTSHLLNLSANVGGKQGPYVKLGETYINTEDPFGSSDLYREGQKTKRWMNIFKVAPGYQFGELSRAEVFYENYYTKYDLTRDAGQNQNENRIGATYYHKFWPKTSALAQYRYVTRDYYDQPGSTAENFYRNDGFLGLAWDATAKINGELKLGYSSLKYENEFNPAGQRFQTKDDLAVEIDLSYQLSPVLSVNLIGLRTIREATTPNANYYVDTTGTLGFRWQAFSQLSFLASGSLGKNEYNSLDGSTARDDKVYKAELSAEYAFLKYLFAKAGYRLDKKDSNIENSSFTDNIYFVGLGGRF